MKITQEALIRLGFEEFKGGYARRIRSQGVMADLLLDWDRSTGLWLTGIDDPVEQSFLCLNHIETVAQLTRFYWLLTGEQLLYDYTK